MIRFFGLVRIPFLLALLVFASAHAQAQTSVQDIRVAGAQRIEPSTVISYMDLQSGDPITRETMNHALKSLFATGLFADVTIQQEGSTLIVEVIENPIINDIAFEGNKNVEDEELLSEVQLRQRRVFTRQAVQNDVRRLHQLYRRNGRFSAEIEPKIIKLDQNRVNLVYEIDEGDVTKISSIRFIGNERFDDSTLRSEISSKETTWYRFITADDRYDPDRLSFDQELLRQFYLAQGYADFEVVSAVAELSNDRSRFFITFTVDEGDRYKFNDITIDSDLRNFDESVLFDQINVQKGDWYDASRIREISDNITDELGDRQYAFVEVRPDLQTNPEADLIDVTFRINETPRVFVERIEIRGNVRTLDKVIRREILLAEGDPFNKSKLARSEQSIRDLDFFETVQMRARPGSAPDKSVIEIDVTEKSTGELSIGAGFSTNDGPLADFRLSERNFLGRGQRVGFSTVVAAERTEFDIGFTEPYFLERDLAAGFNLFHTTRDFQDESSFDQERSGGSVQLSYPLSERWRQTLRYRAERNEITDVSSDASRFITEQEGRRDTSAVSQRLTYDNRDSILFPTEGWFLWLDTEVAGLGGDAQYLSGKTGASYYYPLFDQVVLNTLVEGGAITGYNDEDVAINERFFIGGRTLRGFEQSGIGPRDTNTDDALGGNYFARGTVEASFPIGLPEEFGIKGHTFSDFGTLWDLDSQGPEIVDESSIRASVGVGVSWRSPFGPIRADFATPFAEEDFDQTEVFRFNFGTRF